MIGAFEQQGWSLVWPGEGGGDDIWYMLSSIWSRSQSRQKLCKTCGRSGHQRFKLVNGGWACGAVEWLLRNSVLQKFKEYEDAFILVKCRQSICPLPVINQGVFKEGQTIQDGKLAAEHPAWPGCRNFSCLVLSLAANHPRATGSITSSHTHLKDGDLRIIHGENHSQQSIGIFRQRTIIHFCYRTISGRNHIFCDSNAQHSQLLLLLWLRIGLCLDWHWLLQFSELPFLLEICPASIWVLGDVKGKRRKEKLPLGNKLFL